MGGGPNSRAKEKTCTLKNEEMKVFQLSYEEGESTLDFPPKKVGVNPREGHFA